MWFIQRISKCTVPTFKLKTKCVILCCWVVLIKWENICILLLNAFILLWILMHQFTWDFQMIPWKWVSLWFWFVFFFVIQLKALLLISVSFVRGVLLVWTWKCFLVFKETKNQDEDINTALFATLIFISLSLISHMVDVFIIILCAHISEWCGMR